MTAPLSHQPKSKKCRHPYTNMMPTKALSLTTRNTMDLCLPAIYLTVIHGIKKDLKTRQGLDLIAQPLTSLKTNGDRQSEARWWKVSKASKGKDPKGKRYVGPALAGPVPHKRKSERYGHAYDESDRISIRAASNGESVPKQEAQHNL